MKHRSSLSWARSLKVETFCHCSPGWTWSFTIWEFICPQGREIHTSKAVPLSSMKQVSEKVSVSLHWMYRELRVTHWGLGIYALDIWSFISSWVVRVILTSPPWAATLLWKEGNAWHWFGFWLKMLRGVSSMLNSLVILFADGMRDEDQKVLLKG